MELKSEQAAFSQLLITGTLVHEASFEEMQQRLKIDVRPQLVIVLSMDRYPDLAIGKPITWRVDIGQKLVEAINKAVTVPFLWVWVAEGVLALLPQLTSDTPDHQTYKDQTLRMVRDIQNRTDAKGFSVSAGIGTCYDNPYMLHYSFEEANESMIDRFFQGNRLIFQYEKRKSIEKEWKKAILHEEKMELLARVRIGDEEGSVAYLKILLERLAQAYKHNVDMFKAEAIDLIMSLSRIVLDWGGNASEILSESGRVIQDLYSTIRYDKFVPKVCIHWEKLVKQLVQTPALEVSPVIRLAILYIKENHQQKISLKQIAQYCCLSTHHFSHLFKKEVGISFVDFLNKIRIEKAVHFLETTDMTVQQIAMHVGFQDANYFARKFKTYMKGSPTGYRIAKLC